MNYTKRREALSEFLGHNNLDGFFVTGDINVSYLSGFRGSDSMILATRRRNYFITDFRYIEYAVTALKGFVVERVRHSTYETFAKLAKKLKLKTIGFESMQLPAGAFTRLRSAIHAARLVPLTNAIEMIRAIKDADEIESIRCSIALARRVLTVAHRRFEKNGITESLLGAEIEMGLLKRGGRAAFHPIVAVGANASKPHAIPGRAKILKNCVVLIDLGAVLNGYNSDLTRTTLLGRIPRSVKKIYSTVEEAQRRAIRKVHPGVKISEIDLTARRFIQKSGYGKYFGHSLGHGVGMEVHEAPAISQNNHTIVREGMVFTIEPGIYIPGVCGVRIEDMVLVTKSGSLVLSQ